MGLHTLVSHFLTAFPRWNDTRVSRRSGDAARVVSGDRVVFVH
jgi:hypothetical protein